METSLQLFSHTVANSLLTSITFRAPERLQWGSHQVGRALQSPCPAWLPNWRR